MKIIEILMGMNLIKSKPEARRCVAMGAVKINGIRATEDEDFNESNILSIQVGKTINLKRVDCPQIDRG